MTDRYPTEVPAWVRDRLADLPAALSPHIGETFTGVVIGEGLVQLREPAVRAPVDGEPPVGSAISARLEAVDPVRFSAAS